MTAKTETRHLPASHLAIEHALLFETQILGGVRHYSEGRFGIMPGRQGEDARKHLFINPSLIEVEFSPKLYVLDVMF